MSGTPAARGRPRDAAAEQAIVEATVGLLAEVGFDEFSIGEVALRAGVGRPTIYRRWPGKLDLVVDAVSRSAPAAPRIPPSAGRAKIVAAIGDWIAEIAGTPIGRAVLALTGATSNHPELRQRLLDGFFRPRREVLARPLTTLVEHGVLRDDVDPETMIDLLLGPLVYRWLYTGEMPEASTIRRSAEVVWDALTARQ